MSRLASHAFAALAAFLLTLRSIDAVPPVQASAPAAIATIELA